MAHVSYHLLTREQLMAELRNRDRTISYLRIDVQHLTNRNVALVKMVAESLRRGRGHKAGSWRMKYEDGTKPGER